MQIMFLSSTDSISAQVSSGTPTSGSPVNVFAYYEDDAAPLITEGNIVTQISGSGVSIIVPAPTAGVTRMVKEVLVTNTTSGTVHLKLNHVVSGSSVKMREEDIVSLGSWAMSLAESSSSSGTTYTAGSNIDITGSTISVKVTGNGNEIPILSGSALVTSGSTIAQIISSSTGGANVLQVQIFS